MEFGHSDAYAHQVFAPRPALHAVRVRAAWRRVAGAGDGVAILEGPDAPMQNLWLHRITDGEPPDVEKYLREKVEQQRLIYEFEITKAYGQY